MEEKGRESQKTKKKTSSPREETEGSACTQGSATDEAETEGQSWPGGVNKNNGFDWRGPAGWAHGAGLDDCGGGRQAGRGGRWTVDGGPQTGDGVEVHPALEGTTDLGRDLGKELGRDLGQDLGRGIARPLPQSPPSAVASRRPIGPRGCRAVADEQGRGSDAGP